MSLRFAPETAVAFALALVTAGAVALVACNAEPKSPEASTPNVLGHVYRDGAPLAYARMWRTAPPLADGGTPPNYADTDTSGFFWFRDLATPLSLRVFDAAGPLPRTLYEVVGLGRTFSPANPDDPLHPKDLEVMLRFGAVAATPSAWQARVRLNLDDDPKVASLARTRTLIFASGGHFVGLASAPSNPGTSVDVDVAWSGDYETFLHLHVLRVSDGSPLQYAGRGEVDIGRVRGGATIERRTDIHVVETQTLPFDVVAPDGFTKHVGAALDFGEGSTTGVLAADLPSDAIVVPKLEGARVWLTGRVERDGDESRIALPPIGLPLAESPPPARPRLAFAAPPAIAGPADGSTVGADARFAFGLPSSDPGIDGGAPLTSWAHQIELTPAGGDGRLRYVVVTDANEAHVPSNAELGTPAITSGAIDLQPLPPPSGAYEWTVTSRPDLGSVDAWAKDRDVRFERTVRTKPRRVTFRP